MIPKRLQRWLRQIFNPTHPERRRFRPRLEALEDRNLLNTYLVTSTADALAGTLRQAILDANAHPGADTIKFSIGGGGMQSIAPLSPLPTLTQKVTIDGTTQPGWVGDPLINLDGSNAGNAAGLTVNADGCKIKGLVVHDFFSVGGISLDSNNNVVSGDLLKFDTFGVEIAEGVSGNLIGGTTVHARNVISGNVIGVHIHNGSTGNVVEGNYIGTTPDGLGAFANNTGIQIDEAAGNNTVGGTAAGAGNLISGDSTAGDIGILIGADATGNKVRGNKIGTNAAGTAPLANNTGVDIQGSSNIVGGTKAGAGNLISGNTNDGVLIGNLIQGNKIGTNAAGLASLISGNNQSGVQITATGNGNLVQGNKIGTNAAGTAAVANSNAGVEIYDLAASKNTVGGTVPGAGNIIAFNRDGVDVEDGTGNAIRRNSIFANRAFGIDLESSPQLPPTYGNNYQAAPPLTSATFNATTKVMTIKGTLTSTASTTFALEFFANAVGESQGRVYLGHATVTTDGTGSVSFTAKITVTTSAFSTAKVPFITATATAPTGDTSAFSVGVHDPVAATPNGRRGLFSAHRRGF